MPRRFITTFLVLHGLAIGAPRLPCHGQPSPPPPTNETAPSGPTLSGPASSATPSVSPPDATRDSTSDRASPAVEDPATAVRPADTSTTADTSAPAPDARLPVRADPTAWLRAVPNRDVAAASFLRITPGMTKRAEVLEALGPPREQNDLDGDVVLSYQIGPFSQVDVRMAADIVGSVRAQFESPKAMSDLVKELDLERFALAMDATAAGEPPIVIAPDRGLRLVLTKDEIPRVSEIRLEAPRADDFVRRARSDGGIVFREQLADYEQALVMEPEHAEALVGIARIWSRVGYPREAMRRLSDNNMSQEPRIVCRAELAKAGLLAKQTPSVEPKRVLDQYFLAIQSAQRCLANGEPQDALDAHEVLFEAHLGAARYIAGSSFRNKSETVAKWLASAEALLRHDDEVEELPSLARWDHGLAVLECHLALGGTPQSQTAATWLTRSGDRLLGRVTDDMAQRYVRMTYGRGLLLAARSLLMAGDAKAAESLASRAAELLATAAQQLPPNGPCEAWLGQTYFFLGSLDAVGRRDHEGALRWYDRALPLLNACSEPECDMEMAEVGDAFVSIGISYWETGARGEGLRWTERGLAVVQEAAKLGRCSESAQGVACGNLAFMYEALGQSEKSRQMAELARRYERPSGNR